MSAATFTTPAAVVERDRWSRPLVTPPGGGKAVPYTRATTFVDCLDDKTNLARWQQRKVALGLAARPDLLLAVATTDDPDGAGKGALNRACEDAMEAAQSRAAATTGTALHKFTERMDRGEDVGHVPLEYRPDLDAYRDTTSALDMVAVENFVVLDQYQVGGTFDRLVVHEGRLKIADIKTGGIDYGAGKIAMQLAVYAHSAFYDPVTGERTPIAHDGLEVDLTEGIVIHLPAGTGTCTLHRVDLTAGWEQVPLAAAVRAWRSRKGLITALDASTPARPAPTIADPDLPALIALAGTVDDLLNLWQAHQDIWTDALTQQAAARKRQLLAA